MAVPSAVWIPMRMSSPSPTASAWSGKLETVAVSACSYHQGHSRIKIHGRLDGGVIGTHYSGEHTQLLTRLFSDFTFFPSIVSLREIEF